MYPAFGILILIVGLYFVLAIAIFAAILKESLFTRAQRAGHAVSPITNSAQRSSWTGGWVVGSLGVFLVVAGAVTMLYERGVPRSAVAVTQVAGSVRDASADAATTVKVETALALSKSMSSYDISVHTRDGMVTLEGVVPTEEMRGLAGEIATDTTGVAAVDNQLAVDPGSGVESADRATRKQSESLDLKIAVESALRRTGLLSDAIIGVRVEGNRVVLEGFVSNRRQKTLAGNLVRSVDGVAEVRNNLEVLGQEPIDKDSTGRMTVRAPGSRWDPSERPHQTSA